MSERALAETESDGALIGRPRAAPRRLPPSGVEHIVFCLFDAIPVEVIAKLETTAPEDRISVAEPWLDAGLGGKALAGRRPAGLMREAVLKYDAHRYRLMAWCVMPTHVHLLVGDVGDWSLDLVAPGLKYANAKRADGPGRAERYWAPEYFRRTMRNDREIEETRRYIEANPVAAGLCASSQAWRWSSASARRLPWWW